MLNLIIWLLLVPFTPLCSSCSSCVSTLPPSTNPSPILSLFPFLPPFCLLSYSSNPKPIKDIWVVWWFRERHLPPAKSGNHPLSLFVILVRKHIILSPILDASSSPYSSVLFLLLNLLNPRIPRLSRLYFRLSSPLFFPIPNLFPPSAISLYSIS